MNLIDTKLSQNVIAKAREQKIKDFSYAELQRCFKDVVGPKICIRRMQELVKAGLTIEDIYK